MFKFDELEELKKAALDRDAFLEVLVYQNEQILRELKSSGWKLKVMSEK
jgi:hypothetical protein